MSVPGAARQRVRAVLWPARQVRNHGIAGHLGGAGRLEKVECASRPFVQCARSAMISRTRVATGSASTMVSIASRRLLKQAVSRMPAGRKAPSQTVAQSAKSAIRGNRRRRTRQRVCRLVAGMIGRTDVDSLSFTTPAMACPTSRREAPGDCHGRKEGQVHGSSGRINNETYSLGNVLYVIGSLATGSHA